MKKIFVFIVLLLCIACNQMNTSKVAVAQKAWEALQTKILDADNLGSDINESVKNCTPTFERNQFVMLGKKGNFETLSSYCEVKWKDKDPRFTDYLVIVISNEDEVKGLAGNRAYYGNKDVYLVSISMMGAEIDLALPLMLINYDSLNGLSARTSIENDEYTVFIGKNFKKENKGEIK